MAVTARWYQNSLLRQYGASPINFTSDTIKVALCTSAYAYNVATHTFFSDVTNEITGTGYTAGGVTLTSPTSTLATGVITLSAANAVWTTATITAHIAVIYKSTGVSTTSPLMGYVDFGADVSSTAATFTITWSGSGIFTLTPA